MHCLPHGNAAPALLLTAFCLGLSTTPAGAGVVLDGSLGGPAGSLAGPNYAITANLGSLVGRNLFHSFTTFSLGTSEVATFSGPGSVSNIISRVTGGGVSNIDGRIASGIAGANFYFLNPAGIIFGANASLDISGSAHFSTGSYLGFADGAVFSASASPAASTLTAADPAAFGFLGRGNPLSVNGAALAVGAGKTLELSGGDLALSGADLYADGGSIDLSAQASGSVSLVDSQVTAWNLGNTPPGSIRITGGQITLERSLVGSYNNSGAGAGGIFVSSSGALRMDDSTIESDAGDYGRGGDIMVLAGDVALANGSRIDSSTDWAARGGSITVSSAGLITADGEGASGNASGISANTSGWGDAGDVSLSGRAIRFRDGAQVGSTTFGEFDGAGAGGYVFLSATEDVLFSGIGPGGYPSGALANTFGPGSAGYVSVVANELTLSDGGLIGSSSYGRMASAGDGGFIYADVAGRITLSGVNANGRISGIYATTRGPGYAGSILLNARELQLLEGAQVNSSTSGTMPGAGDGGYISVNATDSMLITGVGRSGYPSALVAETYGTGNAGYISLETGALTVADGGAISSGAYGTNWDSGSGGGINANVSGRLTVSGVNANERISGIYANTIGPGSAGYITLNARELQLLEGGQVGSTSFDTTTGAGDGGYISISATDSTLISGVGRTGYPSAIVAETLGPGNAGYIELETGSLTMTDGGTISSGTYGTDWGAGRGGDIRVIAQGDILISGVNNASGRVSKIISDSDGPGAPGSITVEGRRIELSDGGRISSTAYAAVSDTWDWGAIYVTASESLRVAGVNAGGDRSEILTDVRQGTSYAGDIYIDSPRLEVLDGGRVSSAALSEAPGARGFGIVDVASDSVLISGVGWDGSPSEISTVSTGPGFAGDIYMNVSGNLTLTGGGRISSSALGQMQFARGEGVIDITSGSILISGASPGGSSSGIFTDTQGPGLAGNITLNTPSLVLRDGGQISSSSQGLGADAGSGGYIEIMADRVELSGVGNNGTPTRISAASSGPGNAGDIRITATDAVILSGGAEIVTRADQADGGNIALTVGQLVHLTDSRITTSVGSGFGNGGNIDIDPVFVILNNSVIQANAYGGNGGNIRIVTDYLISSTDSRIEASSQLGIAGSIEISSPNVDVGSGLMVLPSGYLDASLLLRDACAGSRGAAASNSFVGAGNGGLPQGPGGLFTSRYDELFPSGMRGPQARPGAGRRDGQASARLAFSCGLHS